MKRSAALAVAASSLLGAGALQAQTLGLQARPQARVTSRVDRAVTTTLANTHPAVVARAKVGARVAAGTQLGKMVLMLKPSDEQETALTQLLDAQQDRSSASFHKWLTPATFGQSFGVASSDISAVTAWMVDSGLQVQSVSQSGRFITFTGTSGAVESAFGTEMHHLTVDGEQHISNTTDLVIPAALTAVVRGVARLNDFTPKSQIKDWRKVTAARGSAGLIANTATPDLNSGSGAHYVGAADLATILNTGPLTAKGITGKGTTIAVLARSNISLADVQTYRSVFGLPANNPNIMVIDQDPGENSDDIEAFLDAEMAGALAYDATVDFIVSSASGVGGGIDTAGLYAVDNNIGDVITLSYGGCETNDGVSGTGFWSSLWEEAAAQGQTAFVSSGDSGAAGCSSSSAAYGTAYGVNALGSSNYNVAVGGSMFVDWGPAQYWTTSTVIPYDTALGYVPEGALNQGTLSTTYLNSASTALLAGSGIFGTGGGISIYAARPSWQTGSAIPTSADAIHVASGTGIATGSPITGLHRLVPDLSTVSASGHDATAFCAEGVCAESASGGLSSWGAVGGTSVATPVMASAQALINAANGGRQGNANYFYYALAQKQYLASTTACQANVGSATNTTVTPPASTCNFRDITAGSNIVSTSASDTTGIGFSAGTGFDEATGLGSPNVANLAANWSSVTFNATTTTLSLTPTTASYGGTQNAAIAVSSSAGTPTGDVSVIAAPTGTTGGTSEVFTLSGGSVNGQLNALPAGTYNVAAHYPGDGTFAASDSAPVAVTIGKSASTLAILPYNTPSYAQTSSFTYGSGGIYLYTYTTIPGSGSASGQVTYTVKNGSTPLPSLTTTLDTYGTTYLQSGQNAGSYTRYNYQTLTPGSYTVTATYAGDNNVTGSTTTTAFTVAKATPGYSLTSNQYEIASGQSTSFTMTLTTPTNAAAPTGNVTFTDTTTGAVLGTVALSGTASGNPQATLTTTAITSTGTHTISASYAGDSNYNALTPGTIGVVVGALTATTTTVSVSGAAGYNYVGGSPTVTATLSNAPTAASSVRFFDGTVLLGTSTVAANARTATIAATNLAAGSHTLTAQFIGTTTLAASKGSTTLTVLADPTTMTIGGTNSAAFGQNVTVNASFSRAYSVSTTVAPVIAPTGSIYFYDGGSTSGTLLGSVVPTYAVGGYNKYTATLSTSTLAVGSHSILAYYPGDANYGASSSVIKPVTISAATPPSVSVSPVAITYGTAATTLSAVITGAGASLPSGAVTFQVDGGMAVTAGCTSTNTQRTCSAIYSTGTLGIGTHTILATVAADSNYQAASGTGILTVAGAGSLALYAVPTQTAPGSQFTVLKVTGVFAGNGYPSAPIVVQVDNGAPSVAGCTAWAATGFCTVTYPTASLSAGNHMVSVSYAGDNNYAASSTTGSLLVLDGATSIPITVSDANGAVGQATVALNATVHIPAQVPGTVQQVYFQVDGGSQVLAACSLIGGNNANCVANYPTGSLPAGYHSVSFVVPADGYYVRSAGGGVMLLK